MFIPPPCFPENTSGKVERKALVEDILGEFDEDDFKHYTVSTTTQTSDTTHPMTVNEKTLQEIWSQFLGVGVNIIKQDDSFLRLGGDSVDMIRMVTMLRQKELHLSPVEAMVDPKLSSVASKITLISNENATAKSSRTTPFFLLRRQLGAFGAERLAASAAEQCGVAQETIENIYPCTALQEGLLYLSEKIPGLYFYRQAWSLDADIDIDRFVAAYHGLCKAHPILRTRVVRGDDGKSYQVVLHDDALISFDGGDEVGAHMTAISGGSGTLNGKPLHSVSIHAPAADPGSKFSKKFVRIIHHALYDAWSLANLDAELAERYAAAESFLPPEIPSYTRFIEYITKQDPNSADEYWKHYLGGARQTCWPSVPHSYQPQTTACIQTTFELEWNKSSTNVQDHTKAAVARLAWAILLGKYSNETDVSFGVALSGRDAPIEGIEGMTATVILPASRMCWN
ncbi:CoA-dependent acyltransferase [Periconia macrospinosa]|uniref:CoA-dependent acyltransferase n=1 Tax=Periconia macrospinosa TaxID=97972 RepID=A0A2V1D6V1_9PLEO|nr:CoA-dependent acyltransferase [Periconia macrospinosa]